MAAPKIARAFDSASFATGADVCARAAQFIPCGARVLEVGSDAVAPHLPFGCSHRVIATEAFADARIEADIVILLNVLRTQANAAALLGALARTNRPAVIGFQSTDDLTFLDLIAALDRAGLRIEADEMIGDDDVIVRVSSKKPAVVAPCSVAVLGGNMTFAERLGSQMIASLLPGAADVHHINLGDLTEARDRYDLAVLGTGQGLCRSLVSDEVLDVVDRARIAVGIFGTQQRDLIARDSAGRLLDRLDLWAARNEEDVLMYGRGRDNVFHLGDWLIAQFPLGQARDEDLLTVREDTLADLPLDRAIQAIQRHRAVFAHTPAALLCALTTADTVAYADVEASGEFRSLLIDIFGRSFPEREFFQVDREAVTRYRARAHGSVDFLRKRIGALLRRRASA